MTRFAERLAALLPGPLERVFLVSTGSEANDLALRLARAATGPARRALHPRRLPRLDDRDLRGLDELGRQPAGRASRSPSDVHPVLSPDTYRGPIRRGRARRGGALRRGGARRRSRGSRPAGRAPAAFICEALYGNAGGIVLPDGYLAGGLRARARGRRRLHRRRGAGRLRAPGRALLGLRAAGRRARHRHDREGDGQRAPGRGGDHDARRSPTRCEGQGGFFASVGGGPVSCEIGLAVLDVIEEERLQENALRVGGALRAGLERARRAGTRSPAPRTAWASTSGSTSCATATTKEPAREEAYAICERLRERGAIVQPTGDGENVLKLKPPLVFERARRRLARSRRSTACSRAAGRQTRFGNRSQA